MSLKVRKVNLDNDYAELKKWWVAWKWVPFPKALLPPTGFMVYDGDVNICAGWLYKTDSKICWGENIISNKEYKANRAKAITMLIEAIEEEARALGFSMIMTATKSQGLVRKYIASGYLEADKAMEHFVRIL